METIQKSFRAMGTINTITVFRKADFAGLEAAARRVLELDDRLSVFKPDSDISRINRMAGKGFVKISPDTLGLLKTAKAFSEMSGGAFSVTTRPLTELWGVGTDHSAVPGEEILERARRLVDDRDLVFDEPGGRAMLRREGQAIDLGGIAKGFAADEARRVLAENGVEDAIINFGGTVIVTGRPRDVGIQHPGKSRGISMGHLRLQNCAIVTSGSYERFSELDSQRRHHIMDPATGEPSASGLCSVTLTGSSATALDAISTAIFVMGIEKGARLASENDAEAVFISDGMDVLCSPSLRERFVMYPNEANKELSS